MADKVVLLWTAVQLLSFICNFISLDGYAFPVYTTESCPTSQAEWNERSTALNCTQSNAYMCVPDENISKLLEFCYSLPQIQIQKGFCMLLNKNNSTVDSYDCRHLSVGCPTSNNQSHEVLKYRSCFIIVNGCFVAEPTCVGDITPDEHLDAGINLVQNVLVPVLVVMIIIEACCILYLFLKKYIRSKKMYTRKNRKEYRMEQTSSKKEHIRSKKRYTRVDNDEDTDPLISEDDMESSFEFWSGLHPSEENEGTKADNKEIRNITKNESQNALCCLINACTKGDDDDVKDLLNKVESVNAFDKDNFSPLLKACVNERYSTVNLLLQNGADVNLKNENEISPLWIACQNGQYSIVNLLLYNRADIDLSNKNGASPLWIACQNEHYSIVHLLLCKRPDVNKSNKEKQTSPLWIACEKGQTPTVELLLANYANINQCDSEQESPLYVACNNNHATTVKYLLEKGADINLYNKTKTSPLFIACHNGHTNVVETLLTKNAMINLCRNDEASPLWIACQNGHDTIVQLLLKYDASVNLCNNNKATPLWIACQNGHEKVVNMLLKKNADINLCENTTNYNPLCIAREKGHLSIVNLLRNPGTYDKIDA